jgi:hypothetical protein
MKVMPYLAYVFDKNNLYKRVSFPIDMFRVASLTMSLTAQKAIHRVPLELWLKIFTRLPEMPIRKLAVAFRKGLPGPELKHSKAWDAIFDDYEWLNYMAFKRHHCMLLGYDLHFLYSLDTEEALREKSDEINLVLICGEQWISNQDITSMFLKCLKKTTLPIVERFPDEVTIAYGKDRSHTIKLSIRAVNVGITAAWASYGSYYYSTDPIATLRILYGSFS